MRYWLVKTEPETFAWDQLLADGQTSWDGVRNLQARNNLRVMAIGDAVLVYHSGRQRAIVGLARCAGTAYRDPTSSRAIWSAVDIEAVRPLNRPVSLAEVKAHQDLAECALVRRPRLSVMELSEDEFQTMLTMSDTPIEGVTPT